MLNNLKIWTNTPVSELLAGGIEQGQLLVDRDAIAEADIAFGQPDTKRVIDCTNLKWIHLSTAGYTSFDRDDVREALRRRGGILTNSSSVFDEPCAEHLLAMMLAWARQLPAAFADQNAGRGWIQSPVRKGSRLLVGQTALLVGYGAIARRLAEMLTPLKMNLIGLRRTPQGDETIAVHRISELLELLPTADHVINILPANTSTARLFDEKHFAAMKTGAVFYNIGRGSTVDQPALIASLKTDKLAAAMLDVTNPEPLPPDNPLWTTPNCYITPHSGGGHVDETQRLARHFLENLRRCQLSEPLMDRVF